MNPNTPDAGQDAPHTLLRFVHDGMIGALLNTLGGDLSTVVRMARDQRADVLELARAKATIDAVFAILRVRASFARPASAFDPNELPAPFPRLPRAQDLEAQGERLRSLLSDLSFYLPLERACLDHYEVVLKAFEDFTTMLAAHGRQRMGMKRAALPSAS